MNRPAIDAALAAFVLAALFASAAAAAPARLHAAVTLDPDARELRARGELILGAGAQEVALAERFVVERAALDGRPLDGGTVRDGRRVWRVPAGAAGRTLELAWRGTLEPLDGALSHRDTLRAVQPVAGARGSFLPSVSLWHPVVADGLSGYTVALDLPAGQKALVPGRLVEESEAGGRYRARFEFGFPADGVDLMAGPYRVEDRRVKTAAGRDVRLRTYFHPEIADLAAGYLDAVKGYIDLYEGWIDAYPFTEFSVVSSPTPTGFGMPTLTYLGVDVLRLPFIRATSLGHEVLHNWWGNGVFPDYASGNWSEGLTTFMADYAYREREGEAAARAMRLEWLRDFAAVPPSADRPLASFTARYHGASQIVGYHKAAMVFLMLRDRIGRAAFDDGLRRFWQAHKFKTASWRDVQRAFEAASGASLDAFFAQWLERTGAPDVRLGRAERAWRDDRRLRVELVQSASAYRLDVPLRIRTERGEETHVVELAGGRQFVELEAGARPTGVALDPELRLFRRLAPDEAPPILRAVMVDPSAGLVVLTPALAAGANGLAARLLEHAPKVLSGESALPASPLVVVGGAEDTDRWLARNGLPSRPGVAGKGEAQVWTVARKGGGALVLVSVRDAAALAALARPLPHYGRSSWLVLEGGRVTERGTWPGEPAEVRVE